MLEPIRDQAAGLCAWHWRAPLRVLAVVASERTDAALELLWWLRRGYADWGLDSRVIEGAPERWGEDAELADVWLWHAPAAAVAAWWPAAGGHPLVALRAEPAALVDGYRSLKHLRRAGFAPIAVALSAPASHVEGPDPALAAACAALARTCQRHLQWAPAIWTLGYDDAVGATPTEAVLARLLDAAWTLDLTGDEEAAAPSC
ncbi:hypothetical protein [Tepidimonas charontis]|uniref:Uncharacterized protein n=1 Tax=Tepidimonas charontis TaxID=2267262 RepID=A0A554XG45_9BURK|nr:hypothetical protein [Tepidimonas charontis]TSE34801.1 hypothetical protein Tchar_01154 [Tepidimonas charontis]